MKVIKMRLIAATVLGSSLAFSPFIAASTPDTVLKATDQGGQIANNDPSVIIISKAGVRIENAEHHKMAERPKMAEHHKMAERHEMAVRPDVERPEIEYPDRVIHFERAEGPASADHTAH